jgi:putative FmdB family regulatory protein
MPLYSYQCPHCNHITVEKRGFDEVYLEIECEHCHTILDGKTCKLIDKNIRTTYAQGSVKGRA